MEIRALTGFNETTRRRYGRSYSPLNGISLGNPREAGDFGDIQSEEQSRPDIQDTTEQKDSPKDLKKYIKPILIITALGGLFYVLKKKKII